MKTRTWLLPALLATLTGSAAAQAPVYRPSTQLGPRQPLLSPYLNLLRGGDPASNYYLGTIPERQRRQNAALFSSQIQSLEQQVTQQTTIPDVDEALFQPAPATGHATAFMNLGGYFNQGTVRRPLPPARRPPTGGPPTGPDIPKTPGRPN
jgi:hypothetical protein